jgi:hypothetical protein
MGYWNCEEIVDGSDALAALQANPIKDGLIIADWIGICQK